MASSAASVCSMTSSGAEETAVLGQRLEPSVAELVPELRRHRFERGPVGTVEGPGGGGEHRPVQHRSLLTGAGRCEERRDVAQCDPLWGPGTHRVPAGDSRPVVADGGGEVGMVDRDRAQRDLGETGDEVVADAAGEVDSAFEQLACERRVVMGGEFAEHEAGEGAAARGCETPLAATAVLVARSRAASAWPVVQERERRAAEVPDRLPHVAGLEAELVCLVVHLHGAMRTRPSAAPARRAARRRDGRVGAVGSQVAIAACAARSAASRSPRSHAPAQTEAMTLARSGDGPSSAATTSAHRKTSVRPCMKAYGCSASISCMAPSTSWATSQWCAMRRSSKCASSAATDARSSATRSRSAAAARAMAHSAWHRCAVASSPRSPSRSRP